MGRGRNKQRGGEGDGMIRVTGNGVYEYDYKWTPPQRGDSSGRGEETRTLLGFGDFANLEIWRHLDVETALCEVAMGR